MATRPQQRQHEAGELVPQRQPGEADPLLRVRNAADDEAGLAVMIAVEARLDLVRKLRDLFQQLACLRRSGIVGERGDELDRLAQQRQVLAQLVLHAGVEHRIPFQIPPPVYGGGAERSEAEGARLKRSVRRQAPSTTPRAVPLLRKRGGTRIFWRPEARGWGERA